jgi:prepilin-type N-terminal cleavage/methylation domain-containing protein/prepilin-type processing-associated H-X9-DG protein
MRKRAFTLIELLVVIAIIAILAAILFPVFAQAKASAKRAASLSNTKQIDLSGIMYGADYDDNMPVFLAGHWGDIGAIGNDTTNPNRPKMWAELVQPYIQNYQIYADPVRGDANNFFAGPPTGATPPRTLRNQGLFTMYGYNYLFLSPWPFCDNAEGRSFTQADDAAQTVMYDQTEDFGADPSLGFFMSNAPGMWPIIAPHLVYCILYYTGTQYWTGNWSRLNPGPPPNPVGSIEAETYLTADGANTGFLDGHAKFLKAAALAAGTDYMTASGTNANAGAAIIDRNTYLWNLDSNYFCENTTTPGCNLP